MRGSSMAHLLNGLHSIDKRACIVKETDVHSYLHLFDEAKIHQFSLRVFTSLIVDLEEVWIVPLESLSQRGLAIGCNSLNGVIWET